MSGAAFSRSSLAPDPALRSRSDRRSVRGPRHASPMRHDREPSALVARAGGPERAARPARLHPRPLMPRCGGLPPLWSAVACHRFGVGGVRGNPAELTTPPPTPKRQQAAALQSASKLAHSKVTPESEASRSRPLLRVPPPHIPPPRRRGGCRGRLWDRPPRP